MDPFDPDWQEASLFEMDQRDLANGSSVIAQTIFGDERGVIVNQGEGLIHVKLERGDTIAISANRLKVVEDD